MKFSMDVVSTLFNTSLVQVMVQKMELVNLKPIWKFERGTDYVTAISVDIVHCWDLMLTNGILLWLQRYRRWAHFDIFVHLQLCLSCIVPY